jgi:hypothetical protein
MIDTPTSHAELHDLGKKIRAWQLEQVPKLTDTALRSRYVELGSSRTYKRIHEGDGIDSLDADEWLGKYQEVWNRIESDEIVRSAEPVFPDLSPTVKARSAVVKLMREVGQQRLVVIQGDTGTGKTVALRALREKYGRTSYLIESHEGWGRLATALRYLAKGLSIQLGDGSDRPRSAGDMLEVIIDRLNARGRRLILLDECQHWGGEMLNALKTLINRTDCVFVVAAMGTLWQKLTSARYLEAKQLTLNRMLARVSLDGPSTADAVKYLERRGEIQPSRKAINHLLDLGETRGDFAFLRRVVSKIEAAAEDETDDERLATAIREALNDLQEDKA